MFNKINNPILFQGDLDRKNYFEGWYYKQVTADQTISLSFIPGVSLNKNDSHSFVQYIFIQTDEQGNKQTTTGYIRFDVDEFSVEENPFRVTVGQSIFTKDSIKIDLADEDFSFKGTLILSDFYPIQQSTLAPNIMGPFAYIPGMQCYHGVISMQHGLKGSLEINQEMVDFSDGRGYIEKDWGNAFPKSYIWLHSNHFQDPDTSLFFSVAHIPFYVTEFEGFIANLVYQGKEYRFATYNRSKCTVQKVSANAVAIILENNQAVLMLEAEVAGTGKLIAPQDDGHMNKPIKEGITGIINLRLEDKITGHIYEDVGQNSGVEIVDFH